MDELDDEPTDALSLALKTINLGDAPFAHKTTCDALGAFKLLPAEIRNKIYRYCWEDERVVGEYDDGALHFKYLVSEVDLRMSRDDAEELRCKDWDPPEWWFISNTMLREARAEFEVYGKMSVLLLDAPSQKPGSADGKPKLHVKDISVHSFRGVFDPFKMPEMRIFARHLVLGNFAYTVLRKFDTAEESPISALFAAFSGSTVKRLRVVAEVHVYRNVRHELDLSPLRQVGGIKGKLELFEVDIDENLFDMQRPSFEQALDGEIAEIGKCLPGWKVERTRRFKYVQHWNGNRWAAVFTR